MRPDDDRRFDGGLTREERKQIVKDAIKEWLDEQFTKFGKWSFYSIVSMLTSGLVYLILKAKGIV